MCWLHQQIKFRTFIRKEEHHSSDKSKSYQCKKKNVINSFFSHDFKRKTEHPTTIERLLTFARDFHHFFFVEAIHRLNYEFIWNCELVEDQCIDSSWKCIIGRVEWFKMICAHSLNSFANTHKTMWLHRTRLIRVFVRFCFRNSFDIGYGAIASVIA